MSNPTITTTGNTSSDDNSSFYGLNAGVLATSGSRVNIVGGPITNSGSHAAPLATDRGGGTVTMTGGKASSR